MAYEGMTSRAPRHMFNWGGQSYNGSAPILQMTGSFRVLSLVFTVKSTYTSMWLKLQSVTNLTSPWSYHFENPVGSSNHLGQWAMYDSTGTIQERWAVPYSHALVNSRYFAKVNFNNSASNLGNRYSCMEW